MGELKFSIARCQGSNQRESRFSRILEIFFEISPLDLGLEVFQFHFHFSKKKSETIKLFHFSFLEKSERNICFTFHFSKKVKAFQISLYFSRKKSEIVHVTLDFVMKNSKELVM